MEKRITPKPVLLLVAIFLVLLATGCQPESQPTDRLAVYLTVGSGELTPEDLQAHSEVKVVGSFPEMQAAAAEPVALLIDRNAVDQVDIAWLQEAPQKYYPVVVMGYGDFLYAFREILPIYGIEGPVVDWSTVTVEPGFCAARLHQQDNENGQTVLNRCKLKAPTVEDILAAVAEVQNSESESPQS
jgi:hypothetical protein